MNPLFFGATSRQLFGIHHPPLGRSARPRSVVLCPTLGQEHIRAHRAYRQLAIQLARQGHHVLRFDYYGTGDSAGVAQDATMEDWLADIGTAAEELQDMGGPSDLVLVGLRFGGALVAQAQKVADGRDVVLWDPVVRGKAYVDELNAIIGGTAPASGATEEVVGIGGVHVSRALHAGIIASDLTSLRMRGVRRALVLLSRADPDSERAGQFTSAGWC